LSPSFYLTDFSSPLLRCWELLAFCTGTFPPGPELKKVVDRGLFLSIQYVAAYIIRFCDGNSEVCSFARFCLRRLERVLEAGPRKFLPSIMELVAVKAIR
jgi:hypothetical protein